VTGEDDITRFNSWRYSNWIITIEVYSISSHYLSPFLPVHHSTFLSACFPSSLPVSLPVFLAASLHTFTLASPPTSFLASFNASFPSCFHSPSLTASPPTSLPSILHRSIPLSFHPLLPSLTDLLAYLPAPFHYSFPVSFPPPLQFSFPNLMLTFRSTFTSYQGQNSIFGIDTGTVNYQPF
jgi:hypothetical protein